MTKKISSKKSSTTQKTRAKKSKAMKKPSASKTKIKKRVQTAAKVVTSSKTRARPSTFSSALKVYEAGLKMMGANEFKQARDKFEALVEQYPTETEILDRVNMLLDVCLARIEMNSRASKKLKTSDDFYEVGVWALNRHDFESAIKSLQSALKLAPKADYVHYALAATFSLQGDRSLALESLK